MSFLSAFFYDNFMKATEDACLKDWRKDLLQNVTGKVLEIGAGTGSSIDLYPDSPTLEVAFAGNCHLNRETENYITNAGFILKEIKHESMRKAMPLVRPAIRGIATKS